MPSSKPKTTGGLLAELKDLQVRGEDRLLTPAEVALLFGVDPKTVTRWASSGKITSVRTPSGHRRFWFSLLLPLLTENGH
jgi:excisionase family DNA binding protein